MDLALNNLQRLICNETQPTNQPTKKSCLVFDTPLHLIIRPQFLRFTEWGVPILFWAGIVALEKTTQNNLNLNVQWT